MGSVARARAVSRSAVTRITRPAKSTLLSPSRDTARAMSRATRRVRPSLIALGAAALLVGAGAASGFAEPSGEDGKQRAAVGGLVITPGRYGITRLGHFFPGRNASLRAAIRAFGKPSHIRSGRRCKVAWRDKRLRISFENHSGHGDACSRRHGLAQAVVIKRSPRWHTTRHLRVGHPLKRLRRLYPSAEHHGAYWWLKTTHPPRLGPRIAVLAARVHHGRVVGFKGWIGAAE